ncbi:hypothetical protein [Suttonella ornithocola]|nr:hypothetical protein [Suttonella ornithocola]
MKKLTDKVVASIKARYHDLKAQSSLQAELFIYVLSALALIPYVWWTAQQARGLCCQYLPHRREMTMLYYVVLLGFPLLLFFVCRLSWALRLGLFSSGYLLFYFWWTEFAAYPIPDSNFIAFLIVWLVNIFFFYWMILWMPLIGMMLFLRRKIHGESGRKDGLWSLFPLVIGFGLVSVILFLYIQFFS